MSVVMRTTDVAVTERADYWRTAASRWFVPMEMRLHDRQDFYGEITAVTIGNLEVCEVAAGPHRATRTERLISRSEDPGYYKLSLPTRGYALISQDGREVCLIPGDLAIYDTSRPFEIVCDDVCSMIVLMFRHEELSIPQRAMRSATARRVSGRKGTGSIVSPLLAGLVAHLDEVPGAAADRLAGNIVDILSTLYASYIDEAEYRPAAPRDMLLQRVKTFIEQHLGDTDLVPDRIAAECFVSTGYLHKLFRSDGTTVSRYVLEHRLEGSRRELLAPALAGFGVAEIGSRWGFTDAANFSHAFKAQFGASPRTYRLTHRECA